MFLLLKKQTFVEMINNHLIDYPTPSNLNYFWNFGFLAGICLAIQLVTGIALAMHYTPHVDLAFLSVEHIMRDINNGWFLRYTHANGASMFFIVVFIHIGRGLYYGSYCEPRAFVWSLGVIILLLMMATAFLGYVLVWGQMSFWAATVITNFFSAFPIVGDKIVTFLWGGFSVDNATLNRFFSLHYLLPFLISGFAIFHMSAVHIDGSNNPLGISSISDKISFFPYFFIKDTLSIIVLLFLFSFFVYFSPNFLGHSDNYIPGNPMVTPEHIIPEWYEWEVYEMFSIWFCDLLFAKFHLNNKFKVTIIFCLKTGLFLTFIFTIKLLIMILYLSTKPLMKEFFDIRCRKKFRFVLKMLNPDIFLTCLTGVGTAPRYSNTQAAQWIRNFVGITIVSTALEKHLESNEQIEFIIHKPSLLYIDFDSSDLYLTKLRRRCKSYLPACLLMERIIKSKKCIQKFVSTSMLNSIEYRKINKKILDLISKNQWPTTNRTIKNSIDNWIRYNQYKIYVSDPQQQLELVDKITFDIKNRIYSIDKLFSNESFNFNQVGYSNLNFEKEKFCLLSETKKSSLFNLPLSKKVMVETPKTFIGKRLLGFYMPIDKVLQQMFLNFLDVITEKNLPANIFTKSRDIHLCLASIYSKLNCCLASGNTFVISFVIENCINNVSCDKILEHYPFPKKFLWLLKRWLNTRFLTSFFEKKFLKRVVCRKSLISRSIFNVLLSKTFAINTSVMMEYFCLVNNVLILSSNLEELYNYTNTFKSSLRNIGLNINNSKTKWIYNVTNKVKFSFFSFDFIIISKRWFLNNLFKNKQTKLYNNAKSFSVFIKPKYSIVIDFKKKIKKAISFIHRISKCEIFKIFKIINKILFSWACYYCFDKRYNYCKNIDRYVFVTLKKNLIKKFRYRGVFRSKWVFCKFIGFGKSQNKKKNWLFRCIKYEPKTKKWSYEYIWSLHTIFSIVKTK